MLSTTEPSCQLLRVGFAERNIFTIAVTSEKFPVSIRVRALERAVTETSLRSQAPSPLILAGLRLLPLLDPRLLPLLTPAGLEERVYLFLLEV